ncbi:hypothetical protein [Paenarthrobacter nitroguajacolicus]|nr:hypothetical protein [Paenarthrobacter nitroguajacolicus]
MKVVKVVKLLPPYAEPLAPSKRHREGGSIEAMTQEENYIEHAFPWDKG